jgi:hypothetical protein
MTSKRGKKKMEERVARICWNTNKWERPSGHTGKSINAEPYECEHGFGHEEWLFDRDKTIDGYHYGYLTPIKKYWDAYQGETYNILLCTYDGINQNWYQVGRLNNVKVISPDECKKICEEYKKRGWFDSMLEEVTAIGADRDEMVTHGNCFNIKFPPTDIICANNGLQLSKKKISFRYTLLQYDDSYEA